MNTHQSQQEGLALTASTLIVAKVLPSGLGTPRPERTHSQIVLEVVVSLSDGSLLLRSDDAAHLRATVQFAPSQLNPCSTPQRLNIYRGLAWMLPNRFQRNRTAYVARLQKPELGPCNSPCAYYMHPAVGDAALHLAAVTSSTSSTLASTSRVPVAVEVYSSFQVSSFHDY